MNDKYWDIGRLDMELHDAATRRDEMLRPLARLIARRILAGRLANQQNAGQTIDSDRQEVAA
jgi:hypothetical protein